MASIQFLSSARRDLLESSQWYEEQRQGLGDEFLDSIDECLALIDAYPQMHPIVSGPWRRALTKRFPFAIYYQDEPGLITVLAVIHTFRSPTAWRDRI